MDLHLTHHPFKDHLLSDLSLINRRYNLEIDYCFKKVHTINELKEHLVKVHNMCVDKPQGKDGEEKDYESFRKFRYKVFVKYNQRKKELERMVNKIGE